MPRCVKRHSYAGDCPGNDQTVFLQRSAETSNSPRANKCIVANQKNIPVVKGRASMILGMTTSTFTLVHVLLSLVGIAWTAIFLVTTAATSLTGFMFPFDHLCHPTRLASYRWWCSPLRSRPDTFFILP